MSDCPPYPPGPAGCPPAPVVAPRKPAQIRTAVTSEDVRHFIWDRSAADNPIEMDLSWSDDEIGHAMRFACQMYNSTRPYVRVMQPDQLEFGYMFLYAIGYHLFMGKLRVLSNQDMDWSAGDVKADLNKRRIEYLTKFSTEFRQEALRLIHEQKRVENISMAFGSY